ncbi:unnamed protein product [Tilletia laevis]|uniref:Asl1-like glycosyl hydrolase catalytic domain-containing protein n=2 Tax=Tilletia TaxID=13289 RepID=A0A177VHB3_9BASI|nr:hypothetical protein CF336_g1654 [Tilletia laevis]KAE8265823.1 hypothetical protein A4X03_0g9 [Tilletia caries]CAD6911942.1 unnamed protein product [Tilletia controversa]KAE8207390.1 hypothetical protein CF335_g1173 [Tilletia laevis]CAD6891274.1 unnamed protein product [Tilletia caries]
MQVTAAFTRLSFALLVAVAAVLLVTPQPAAAVQAGLPWGADPRLAHKIVRGNTNMKWYHNWQNRRPVSTLNKLNYVPTFWGQSKISGWHSLSKWYKRRGKRPKYILGQNEPDVPSQSNTSPKAAARQWMKELHPWQRRGSKVGSAQICWDTTNWLDPFLSHLRKMGGKPHFCAAHYYGSPTDMGRFKKYVRRVRSTCRKHGIKTVWLTEIGVMASSQPSQAQTNHFAREVFRWLDTQKYVKRAAWIGVFKYGEPYDGFMSRKNAFFNGDGSLRSLGHSLAYGRLNRRQLERLPNSHALIAEHLSEKNGTLADALAPLDDPRGQTDLAPSDDEHDPEDDAYWDAKFAKEDDEDPDDDDEHLDLDQVEDDDDAFGDGFLDDLPEVDDDDDDEDDIIAPKA